MKRQTILITGASGLVGSSYAKSIFNNKKLVVNILCPSHNEMDISKRKDVDRYVNKNKPDIIINFAAHRNANTAEEQRNNKKGTAWQANVEGVENIISVGKKNGIYIVHISTDMVFSGHDKDRGPYNELDKPKRNSGRLSWYGWTKLMAEEKMGLYDGGAVIRIGNVTKPIYDPSLDYIGKILWLYDNNKLYPLFDDQYITLSYLPNVNQTISMLIKSKLHGIFHVASSDLVTPHDLAQYLIYKARKMEPKIENVSIDKYLKINPNRYPKYGGLSSEYTQQKLGIKFPSWQKIVDNFIKHAKV